MKKTFSYFPGMFENPAPAKYYFLKNQKKILWNMNYISMRRKIIDDYYFLLIDATDRSKISSDQKRLFFAVSLYGPPFIFRRHSLSRFN